MEVPANHGAPGSPRQPWLPSHHASHHSPGNRGTLIAVTSMAALAALVAITALLLILTHPLPPVGSVVQRNNSNDIKIHWLYTPQTQNKEHTCAQLKSHVRRGNLPKVRVTCDSPWACGPHSESCDTNCVARGRRDEPVAELQSMSLQLHPSRHAPVTESHTLWLTQLVMRVGRASMWMGGQGMGGSMAG